MKKRDHLSVWVGYKLGSMIAGQRTMRTPVAFLYNGVRLPGLPEWDCPYLRISYDSGLLLYSIDGLKTKPVTRYIEPNENTIIPFDPYWYEYLAEEDTYKRRIYDEVRDSSWEAGIDGDYQTGDCGERVDAVIWANYDICTPDGTILLAASEPVPVYE